MRNNAIKFICLFIVFLTLITTGALLIFNREFNRLDKPIMAGFKLIKITVLNMDYILVQENPKVIIAKFNNALDILENYMNNMGFKLVDQLGSFVVFENDLSERQYFSFRVNRYYSIWEW